MRWCARCGEQVNDGFVLCQTCVPRSQLRQSATIHLDTAPAITVDADGHVVASTPGTGHTVVKAQHGGGRSPLRAVEKVEWIQDRQRYERRVWLFDRQNNLYCETCFDVDTGEITWGPKSGPLTDQSIHGPRS